MNYKEYLKSKDKLEQEFLNNPPIKWFGENRDFLLIKKGLKLGYEFVEEYKGNDIWKLGDKYFPYTGCMYCFDNLELCRDRIDMKGVAILPFLDV